MIWYAGPSQDLLVWLSPTMATRFFKYSSQWFMRSSSLASEISYYSPPYVSSALFLLIFLDCHCLWGILHVCILISARPNTWEGPFPYLWAGLSLLALSPAGSSLFGQPELSSSTQVFCWAPPACPMARKYIQVSKLGQT